MSRIVLGVGGGIAAYKAALLLRLMTEDGHEVRVVPTEAALNFVGAPTWEALSHQRVATSVFEDVDQVAHVRIGHEADLVVVAPATADVLAKAATGQAGDLLGATLLTTKAPVVMAPAMHTEMWQHPATRANVATLRSRGVDVIEPASGRLTGTDTGPGRLPEPEEIYARALAALDAPAPAAGTDLRGLRILVSAGGTRESLDPVRFLGNRSSGRQGVALARVAAESGASVRLAAASVGHEVLAELDGLGVVVDPVESTAELQAVMRAHQGEADVVIMAAAVSDFRPETTGGHKLKKRGNEGMTLTLVQNPDILVDLVSRRLPGQCIIGFAAETGDAEHSVLEYGAAKLRRKGADLLVVNQVGKGVGFGTSENSVTLLTLSGGEPVSVGEASGTKEDVARAVFEAAVRLRDDRK